MYPLLLYTQGIYFAQMQIFHLIYVHKINSDKAAHVQKVKMLCSYLCVRHKKLCSKRENKN